MMPEPSSVKVMQQIDQNVTVFRATYLLSCSLRMRLDQIGSFRISYKFQQNIVIAEVLPDLYQSVIETAVYEGPNSRRVSYRDDWITPRQTDDDGAELYGLSQSMGGLHAM